MDFFKLPKQDGTEGTAICEMTYNEGKKMRKFYGCIVKNDFNLQKFIKGHEKQSANMEKLRDTNKYFFYICGPGFKEKNYTRTKVTCHRFSNPGEPLLRVLSNPPPGNIVKVDKHIFLLCDFQDFNDKFLNKHSKEILLGQDLNLNKSAKFDIYGLSYKEKDGLKFIPLKLSHHSSNVYDVDANYEKLESAGPVLLPDNKTVIGRFEKKGENRICISIFGNNQDERSSANGCDNQSEERPGEIVDDENAASGSGADTGEGAANNQQSTSKHQSEVADERSSANDHDNQTGEHPGGNVVADENAASSSGADTSDGPAINQQSTSNQQSDDASPGEDVPDEAILPAEIEKTFGDLSNEDQKSLLAEIEEEKKKLRSSIEIPPHKKLQRYEIRKLTKLLRKNKLENTIKWMKGNLEKGITGPFHPEITNVRDLDYSVKRNLIIHLSANAHNWKKLAENFGFTNVEIDFFSGRKDPAEEVLRQWETKEKTTVRHLYDILVSLDMAVIADSAL